MNRMALAIVNRTVVRSLVFTFVVLAAIASQIVLADDWKAVNNDAINSLLSDRHVVYDGDSKVSQTFHANGTTTFVQGRPSLGHWKAADNQYCSQWPPSKTWSCYWVYVDSTGERIRFSSDAEEWVGVIQP